MASNLKLENFSDRELLHILNDVAKEYPDVEDGWVEVEVMAARLGLSKDGLSEEQFALHARRCLTGRLSWISRLSGTVEKEDVRGKTAPPRYRLTLVGKQVVSARLSADLTKRLQEGVTDYAALHALQALSRRFISADVGAANLMRREWIYGTHRKRRG